MFFSLFLFVFFGQVTVRKLRKKTETKDALGLEFASGWDIFNVAQALSLPRSWARKLEKKGQFYGDGVVARSDLLYEHTNKFDRFLARTLFWLSYFGLFTMLIFILLLNTGVITADG